MESNEMVLDTEQSIEVKGSLEKVFEGVLYRLGEGNAGPDGATLNLQIEPYAGGRWFRDRGAGVQHLWGHVQVIKPPVLLELSGPLFMSYPVINHLQIKLEPIGEVVKVTLRHQAVGLIEEAHRESFANGWKTILDRVGDDFAPSAGIEAE